MLFFQAMHSSSPNRNIQHQRIDLLIFHYYYYFFIVGWLLRFFRRKLWLKTWRKNEMQASNENTTSKLLRSYCRGCLIQINRVKSEILKDFKVADAFSIEMYLLGCFIRTRGHTSGVLCAQITKKNERKKELLNYEFYTYFHMACPFSFPSIYCWMMFRSQPRARVSLGKLSSSAIISLSLYIIQTWCLPHMHIL